MKNRSYVESWRDYRERVQLFYGVWLGGFLITVSLAYALSHISASNWPVLAIGLPWILGCFSAGAHLQLFLCPRCHNQFSKALGCYRPFARRCVHCDLPKWQE